MSIPQTLLLAALAVCSCQQGREGDDQPADPPEAAVPAQRATTTDVLAPAECGTVERVHSLGGIILASQPQPADFEQAAKSGIKTVINQRHASEQTDFDERAVVTGLGLAYHNPAFGGPDELTDEILDQTRELLSTVERPVLMHCASANRTGAVWLAYRVLDDGLPVEQALAEAQTVGLRSPDLERIVRTYIDRRQQEPGTTER